MVIMSYLYRDASNYKEYNAVRLSGNLPTLEEQKIIKEALDCGENFIPEQFGLPLNRPGELNEDDSCWAELNPFDAFEYYEDDKPCIWAEDVDMSVEELVEKFRRIASGEDSWHVSEFAVIIDEVFYEDDDC